LSIEAVNVLKTNSIPKKKETLVNYIFLQSLWYNLRCQFWLIWFKDYFNLLALAFIKINHLFAAIFIHNNLIKHVFIECSYIKNHTNHNLLIVSNYVLALLSHSLLMSNFCKATNALTLILSIRFLTKGIGIIYSKYWLQIIICRLSKHAIIIYIMMRFFNIVN
jgi:hypothetical protein